MAGNHGGAQFELLARGVARENIVPADVLDAWFDPSPDAVAVLRRDAAWTARTSPPACAAGLEKAVADSLELDAANVVAGAGSSDLIFRCLREVLTHESRVFLIDPTYSEYRHVCSKIVGCRVESGPTYGSLDGQYDLIVAVNPNNPTGELLLVEQVLSLGEHLTDDGLVWIDEAYLPFVGAPSMKLTAAQDGRFVVCQSLSKSLALSGLRVAYLVAEAEFCRRVRALTPPWCVSTPALFAATAALGSPDYYAARYLETRRLRAGLASMLAGCGTVREGAANWVTLWVDGPAAEVRAFCRERGVLVRDGEGMYLNPPAGFLRIAVRSEAENARCADVLREALAVGVGR